MKLELNEKLWFGKYKGMRLYDVIDNKPSYIVKMLNEYDVELSEESKNRYYKTKKKKGDRFILDYITTTTNTTTTDDWD